MTIIAHLSDLHFGASDPAQVKALTEDLRDVGTDHVIATGDLTQSGRAREFEEAARWFEALPMPVIAVPGNHDTPVRNLFRRFFQPWSRFTRITGFEEEPIDEADSFVFAGLNSARRMRPSLDWSTGILSDRQLASIGPAFDEAGDKLKLCGFHHPLQGFEEGGSAGRAVLPNSDEVLKTLTDAEADIVMNGHVHKARVSLVNRDGWSFILSQAGTAISTRLRGETASYNLIERAEDGELFIRVNVAVIPAPGQPEIVLPVHNLLALSDDQFIQAVADRCPRKIDQVPSC